MKTAHIGERSKDFNEDNLDLNQALEMHQPFLSEEAFKKFTGLTISYLRTYPSTEETTDASPTNPEIVISEIAQQQEKSISDNEIETEAGIEQISSRFRETALRRVHEEFKACGLKDEEPEDSESHSIALKEEEFELATSMVTEQVEALKRTLIDKQRGFVRLMKYFGSQTESLSEELADRMTEALKEVSDDILESEPMPPPPGKKIFGKKESQAIYESWLKSKDNLVDPQRFPTREEVLEDNFNSASAAFRRALYGSRPMILDRGLSSDPIDEIDTFQRRHFEELGEKYLIALSPTEWASKILDEFVYDLLYGKSDTAKLLDDAVKDDFFKKSARDSRKPWDYRSHHHEKTSAGYSSQGFDYGKHNRTKYEYSEHYEYVNGKQSKNFTDQASNEPKKPDVSKILEGHALATYQDMIRLIDSELPDLYRTTGWREKILDLCAQMLVDREIEPNQDTVGTPQLTKRIIKKLVVKLHPDNPDGDEKLCQEISAVFHNLKVKSNSKT